MSNPYRHPISTPVPELQGHVSIASKSPPSCAPGEVDWRKIAKLAGEHGIRYRTNTALLKFLAALCPQGLDAKEGGE